jgi:hypothetical protein
MRKAKEDVAQPEEILPSGIGRGGIEVVQPAEASDANEGEA